MKRLRPCLAVAMAVVTAAPTGVFAANHREAPITALDHKADITDVYAFVSYSAGQPANTPPSRVTLIMGVDPLLDPANGPNWFPFDPDILYEFKIDNNHDAVEDIVFQFRFTTEQRLPGLFQVFAGVPGGAGIVPPTINSFDSMGLGQRQSYTVAMVKGGTTTRLANPDGNPMYAVPANPGVRSMDYAALYSKGIYTAQNGIKVFAGTTDDAFWIDLGGTFDTLNLHVPPVLSVAQDAANENFAGDTVSGYAVNSIALEVPIEMLTSTGRREPASSPPATIGVWATTSRQQVTIRRAPGPGNDPPIQTSGPWRQVQRMGNPLINELLIGTGSKDRFSMDEPRNDSQFAPFLLDPALPKVVKSLTGLPIPSAPRVDLLPVVQYRPPIAAANTPPGPVADLLRLNTGVPATPPGNPSLSRLGLLGGDAAGFPNGRRVFDDVTDIALRLVVGGVLTNPKFTGFDPNVHGRLGDGVNVNDAPYPASFPYLAFCPSGRDRRHIDPGEPGCTAGGGAPCAP